MRLRAPSKRVLARILAPAPLSKLGLWVPDEVVGYLRGRRTEVGFVNLGRPQIVEVVDVHRDFPERDFLSPGDRLLIGNYFGQRFEFNGEKYVSLELNDILGVLEGGVLN